MKSKWLVATEPFYVELKRKVEAGEVDSAKIKEALFFYKG